MKILDTNSLLPEIQIGVNASIKGIKITGVHNTLVKGAKLLLMASAKREAAIIVNWESILKFAILGNIYTKLTNQGA